MSVDPNPQGPMAPAPLPVPLPLPNPANPGKEYHEVIVDLTAPAHEEYDRGGAYPNERRFRLRAWFLLPLTLLAVAGVYGAYWSWEQSDTARGYRAKIRTFNDLEAQHFAARNVWRTLAERHRLVRNPVRQSVIQREIQSELSLKAFLDPDEREAAARAVQVRTDMEEDLSSIFAEIESGEADKRASFFAGLREKYDRALMRPWEAVEPDPARPVD